MIINPKFTNTTGWIIVNYRDVAREKRNINRRLNRGRARKISTKRPSPWLSKRRYEALQVQARFNAVVAKGIGHER